MATPVVPDFGQLAATQKTANDAATNQTNLANRPNQYNPLGSTTYTMNPDGTWGTNTSLSAPAQGLFDASLSGQQNLAGQLGQGLDYSSLGGMPQVGGYNQQVINSWNALQEPGLARQDEAARARAAAMGLTIGSDPWSSIESSLSAGRTDAGNKAILAGYTQGNTEFNQALAARQQGAGELQNRYDAARTGSTALGGIRDSLNPNKWNPDVKASANYLPQTIYGAAQDTFNAQQMNENTDIVRNQANTDSAINAIRALGGNAGIPGVISGGRELIGAGRDILSGAGGFLNSFGGSNVPAGYADMNDFSSYLGFD